MTARAYLLAGFFFFLLAMSTWSQAATETIPATATQTSVASEYRANQAPYSTGSTQEATVAAYNAAVFPTYWEDSTNKCRFENPRNWTGSTQTITTTCWNKSTGVNLSGYPRNETWGGPSVTEFCSNSSLTLNSTTHTCSGFTYSCSSNQGWTLDGQSCTRTACQIGEVRDSNGQCRSACQPGTKLKSGWFTDTNGDGKINSGCFSGCKGDFKGTGPTYVYWGAYQASPGYVGDFIANGETCSTASQIDQNTTPPSQPAVDTPEYKCATQGMGYGEVNGQVMCVPANTPNTPPYTNPPETTKETNPDGSRQETTNTDTVNGEQVTRTTTTKTYDSQGNETGTTTSVVTAPRSSFCEENPNSSVCKDSSVVGGGDCATHPQPSGDAVQSAILIQQWHTRCEVQKQNDALQDAADFGNQQIEDAQGDVNPLSNPQFKNIMSMFETTNLLGTHACPAPKVISTPLGSWSIPFTEFCNLAAMVGHLILIFASFLSFRIVIGAL